MTENIELEKLKLLFDYTKFHIGVYITLGTALAGLVGASTKIEALIVVNKSWLIAATALMALAGFAGGVLVSSMCEASGLAAFWAMSLGPFSLELMPARYWTYLEHTAFWLSLACAFVALNVKAPRREGPLLQEAPAPERNRPGAAT
ncbi:MAG TPA: hypothetical protein VFZ53_13155 [Polyangiaceae bacterium]